MIDQALWRQLNVEISAAKEQAISFYRLMELALYHPERGYYHRRQPKLGKEGDFFTSVHVGAPFAKALANQIMACLPLVRSEGRWVMEEPCALIEYGAGEGRLMGQILSAMVEQGVPVGLLQVYLIDISPYHAELAMTRLAQAPCSVQIVSNIAEIPPINYAVVYANELLDAFPVQRLRWKQGRLEECFVERAEQNQLVEVYLPSLDQSLQRLAKKWLAEREDEELHFEFSPTLASWVAEIDQWMQHGYVITIDYGGRREERLWKRQGTVRCFYRHQIVDQPYAHLGEIDITSDVPFDYLDELGSERGWKVDFYGTQAQFLIDGGILDLLPQPPQDPFSVEAKQIRMIRQLIHPEVMGERFKVLVQKK